MNILQNAFTLLTRPELLADYLRFQLSRTQNRGEPLRTFLEDRISVGGFSGFSEFHSCALFLNSAERRFLKEFQFSNGDILDVGGNLGLFSLHVARRFPDRIIHTFEPNPYTFDALQRNLARNGCTQIQAHACAVAAHDGETNFQADPVNRATTHIADGPSRNDHASRCPAVVRVTCLTLDTFVRTHAIESVSLLKVDVEGYEELVFKGAEHLLASGMAKTIYYEVCPELATRAGYNPDAASRRLLAHGYRLHSLSEQGHLQPVELSRIGAVTLENWVAIPEGGTAL